MLLSIIWTFLLGLAFLYGQILVMPVFTVGGVIPNILLPWLIYLVWTRERNHALILGFVVGGMFDAVNPETFGMYALLFVFMGLAIDAFRKPFEVDSMVAKLLTIALANIIFSFIQLLIFGIAYGFGNKLLLLSLIGFGYNLCLSFVVFWSMQLLSKVRLTFAND
ncbi:MAG: rod shape-determining protein MreD [Candidatus Cloacimonas sp.]|jgi:rod shape-determining protein MreD|nr:rod shape-determining protein MreD [Candidatus Cloacimonas sp.]